MFLAFFLNDMNLNGKYCKVIQIAGRVSIKPVVEPQKVLTRKRLGRLTTSLSKLRHDIIVGYIAAFGDERDAKFLFDVDGREYSFLGWKSLFHLIASVTGEKFDENL